MLKNIINVLKVNHYIKNLVVIVPLIFSMNMFSINLWMKVAIAFISFCAFSSCVYIFNDLIDKEKDQLHPVKSKRPIASNLISIKLAISLIIGLLFFSLIVSFYLNFNSSFCILIYFILNVFYSLWLKKIEIIDSFCIALGFILRLLLGCFAIGVLPSPLIILMTFFVSMFFTFSKRKLEKVLIKEDNQMRDSIKKMDIKTIEQFVLINAILSIAFYFTYVLDATTIERAHTSYLYLTAIPFSLLIYRLLYLGNIQTCTDDPIHFIEKDTITKWLCVFYFLVLLLVMTILK